jgi:hypothetical protein
MDQEFGLQLCNPNSTILFKDGWSITKNSIRNKNYDLIMEHNTTNTDLMNVQFANGLHYYKKATGSNNSF